MYCISCGKQIAEGAQFCGSCGNQVGVQNNVASADRPIAGIAVGTIFGVIGVVWSIMSMFKSLYGNPAGVEAALYQAFPALQSTSFFSTSMGMVGNSALLIGALLVFLRHPKGNKTVRVTSYCMLIAIFCMFVASYFAVTEAEAWQTIDGPTKGSLIGGLAGGVLGGMFQWGLVIFFFRKKRWG